MRRRSAHRRVTERTARPGRTARTGRRHAGPARSPPARHRPARLARHEVDGDRPGDRVRSGRRGVDRQRAARLPPDDAIVGEEGADQPGTTGLEWHLDPIDGTVNFVYDLPTWCTSVGVLDADGGGRRERSTCPSSTRCSPRPVAPGRRSTERPSSRRRCRRSTWRSSGPGSATPPSDAGNRPPASPPCSPRSVTSAGSARPRSISASSPAVGSTRTSSSTSTAGTWPPVS